MTTTDKSRPKIVVTDGFTTNPGDLSWDALATLGDLTVYDRTTPDLMLERVADAEIVLTNRGAFPAGLLCSLPKLRYIGMLATGFNAIDTVEASRLGITVTNVPAYSTDSVAQMTFALLLAITQRVEHFTDMNRDGEWSRNPDYAYGSIPLIELAGKTFGVVGLGHTGMATARIAMAFGMNVVATTSKTASQLPSGIEPVALDDVFRLSDVVSLHCPLNDSTRNLVDARRISLMKPSAILINTSRGAVVDEHALADALTHRTIYAAGVDVLSVEPPSGDNPLLSAPNCFVTPHIAWATVEARRRLMVQVVENVRCFLDGNPVNVVNRPTSPR